MRSISPLPPTFEPPLGHRFGFRAVMFQGMKSGDEMIMSVKIAACIDQSDCFVVNTQFGSAVDFCCCYRIFLYSQDKVACERFTGRARRDTNQSNNLSEVSTISFRVEMPKNVTNRATYVAANNTGIMSLILTLSFIIMAAIVCVIIKYRSCVSC